MRFFVLIFSLLAFAACSDTQNKNNKSNNYLTGRKRLGISGNVKEMTTISYKNISYKDGKWIPDTIQNKSKTTFRFNKDGFITEITSYSYDEQNRQLISKIITSFENGIPVKEESYVNDTIDNITQIKIINDTLIEETTIDKNGSVLSKAKDELVNNGKTFRHTITTITTTHDSMQKISVTTIITKIFNDDGHEIESSIKATCLLDDKPVESMNFDYEYNTNNIIISQDKKGNPTEILQTTNFNDSTAPDTCMVKRSYQYY